MTVWLAMVLGTDPTSLCNVRNCEILVSQEGPRDIGVWGVDPRVDDAVFIEGVEIILVVEHAPWRISVNRKHFLSKLFCKVM